MENIEDEILKRGTTIHEQVESLKEYIKVNTKDETAYDSCLIVDMAKLKATLNVEKENLAKTLEENKQS